MGAEPAELNISYTMSNNSGAERKVIVFAQHCDKDGYIKKVDAEIVNVPNDAINKPYTFSFVESTYKQDDYVKLYIWDVTDGKYKTVLTEPGKLLY